MKRKLNAIKYLFIAAIAIFSFNHTNAQTTNDAFAKNKNFTGAAADGKMHNVIFQLDSNDPNTIIVLFHSINNALNDELLKGKIHIELMAFAFGTDIYFKNGKYENDLRQFVQKGVNVVQCTNTMHIRNISKDSLFDFIGYVPSGIGELILRQSQGWAVIKP